jgi:hypothetical protein
MHKEFWSENLKGGEHLKDLNIDERIIVKWILYKWGGIVWTGFIWLRLGTRDGL